MPSTALVVDMVIVTDRAALFVTLVEVYDDGVTVAVCEATVTEPTLGASTFAVTLVAVATPRVGVVRLGDVERTTEPEPVDVVAPVPPLATGRVPVTPVLSGRPVPCVRVTLEGVPRLGVEDRARVI